MRKLSGLIIVAMVLLGCEHKDWYSPGVDEIQTKRDLITCHIVADKQVPSKERWEHEVQHYRAVQRCMSGRGYLPQAAF